MRGERVAKFPAILGKLSVMTHKGVVKVLKRSELEELGYTMTTVKTPLFYKATDLNKISDIHAQ